MMKRFISVLLAGIMIVSAAVTALAASPVGTSTITATAESDDGDWDVVVSQNYETEEEQVAVEEILTDYTSILRSVVESIIASSSDGKTGTSSADITQDEIDNMELAYVADVSLTGDMEYYDGTKVTITFYVSEITVNSKVIVLHYINGGWEKKTIKEIGTGYIKVTFDSFSPVAIYIDADTYASEGTSGSTEDTTASEDTEGTSTTSEDTEDTTASEDTDTTEESDTEEESTEETTSPKTGEGSTIVYLYLIAAAAAAGLLISAKRRHV